MAVRRLLSSAVAFGGVCAVLVAAAAADKRFEDGASLPTSCEAVSVGGGWAGVYFAFRLATSGVKVCLFEASDRIGGRTYSQKFNAGQRKEDFTLDVGAYRFSPDMHLPGDLILDVLKLPVACYEPSCPAANLDFPPPFKFNYSAPLVRIVDAEGMPAGYVSAVHGLLAKVQSLGGQVFMNAQLVDVKPGANMTQLHIRTSAGVGVVNTTTVMLNLPRQVILNMSGLRAATPERIVKMQECVKFDVPADLFPPGQKFNLGHSLTKAYAFYDDAWWYTKLNRTVGQWPANAFVPLNTSVGIPIGIHFNDGPVRCDEPGKGCRGFLEVFYAPAEESFFQGLRPDPLHPLGVLNASTGKDSKAKLSLLHKAVMEATDELWTKAKLEKPTQPPTLLVVGVWDRDGQGYTAPTKVYYSASNTVPGGPDPLEKACGVPGLNDDEYRRSVLAPTSSKHLIVANNDWVAQSTETLFGDWAEESLLQAERGLRNLGFERPFWLDAKYYDAKVTAFTSAGGGTSGVLRSSASVIVV